MTTDLFVYGTLCSGGSNHARLGGSSFVGTAETAAEYALADVGAYKGLVAGKEVITGEVWRVSSWAVLRDLDMLEGVEAGLYARAYVRLQNTLDNTVQTYMYTGALY